MSSKTHAELTLLAVLSAALLVGCALAQSSPPTAVPPAPAAAVGDLEVDSSGRPTTCAYKDLGAVGYVFEGDATVRCRQVP